MELSLEQEAYLLALRSQAEQMSREQLIAALLQCEQQRMVQMVVVRGAIYAMGGVVQAVAADPPCAPDLEELTRLFGYEPTEGEAWDYWRNQDELATMDVDLEEIVIGGPIEEELELEELERWRN